MLSLFGLERWRFAGFRLETSLGVALASQDFDHHRCSTGTDHIQGSCSALGEVDNSASNIGPSIIDPDHHRQTVGLVGDLDPCAELEGFMGRGHVIHVVSLAIGSLAAVEPWAIPGRNTGEYAFLSLRLRQGRRYGKNERQGGAGGDPQKFLHIWNHISLRAFKGPALA